MDKKNENEKKDTKKYIIIGIAAVAVLAIGIIIGVVIGNSGKKDNDKQVSSDPVGTVVDNSGNTTQVDEKNSDSNTQTENKDNSVSDDQENIGSDDETDSEKNDSSVNDEETNNNDKEEKRIC